MAWDENYRMLAQGEMILPSDEVQNDDASWRLAGHTAGTRAPYPHYTSHRVYRRAIQ